MVRPSPGCKGLLTILLSVCLAFPAMARTGVWVLRVPLAGAQYHALEVVWQELAPGETLALIREPLNRHDPLAIRIQWRGHPLGYVPRVENAPLAAAMDEGEQFFARVVRLSRHEDPWQRMVLDIFLVL